MKCQEYHVSNLWRQLWHHKAAQIISSVSEKLVGDYLIACDKRNVNAVMLFIQKIQVNNGMPYKRGTLMSKCVKCNSKQGVTIHMQSCSNLWSQLWQHRAAQIIWSVSEKLVGDCI